MPIEAAQPKEKEKPAQNQEPIFVSRGKRIIKMGNQIKALGTYVFHCRHCDCIFEANSEDYTKHWVMGEMYCTSNCPCCGKQAYGEPKNG